MEVRMTALDDYLASPECREEVRNVMNPFVSISAHTIRAALAAELEEARGHIMGLLPCASPECCNDIVRGMCTATAACDFAHGYREGAK
jgi:hypothetical protein